MGLGKIGAYSQAIELLYRSFKAQKDAASLSLKNLFIDNTPRLSIPLHSDWHKFLTEFSHSPAGGRVPLRLGMDELRSKLIPRADWADGRYLL